MVIAGTGHQLCDTNRVCRHGRFNPVARGARRETKRLHVESGEAKEVPVRSRRRTRAHVAEVLAAVPSREADRIRSRARRQWVRVLERAGVCRARHALPPPPARKSGARRLLRRRLPLLLSALERKGLSPSAPTDRRTLLRRVTFDLTGLPPTPDQIATFVADKSPDAYEKVVDKLLASPQYGERWGRHWLDVARYAESNGYEFDEHRPDAWRYRDYVVRSFNANKPFDRFVKPPRKHPRRDSPCC